MDHDQHYDVVVLGAGLAGLTFCRQLLLNSSKRILHLEKRKSVPIKKQKVGESTVQLAGYYFSKILDLEEYLFTEHVMKYNLRFLWKSANRANDDYEDYGQGYIRKFSNIASYQIDRNKFEAELIRRNREDQNYILMEGVSELKTMIEEEGPHKLVFQQEDRQVSVLADWVVDATGRKRSLARQMDMGRESTIGHSASYFWVDGIVNIEKLTRSDARAIRRRASKRELGHSPMWLSTNQFMGEGYWFWVITLQGRTSFGLVFDHEVIDPKTVNTGPKLLQWLFAEFPLFEPELRDRKMIDFATLNNYSHDCGQTIHKNRWAITGEAGRFSDPLYSPASDGVAIHNTLIIDAILTEDRGELENKLGFFESMCKVVYRSFIPSFQESYRALGDQETFVMKYGWELSVYFVFYVFPFINELFTDKKFLIGYLRRFGNLGSVNHAIQTYITGYYHWKKDRVLPPKEPVFFDFTKIPALNRAEETFYRVGLNSKEAMAELDRQTPYLFELARFFMVHIDSIVLDDPELYHNKAYIEGVDPASRVFEPTEMVKARTMTGDREDSYAWTFDPCLLRAVFHGGTTVRGDGRMAVIGKED